MSSGEMWYSSKEGRWVEAPEVPTYKELFEYFSRLEEQKKARHKKTTIPEKVQKKSKKNKFSKFFI